MIFFHDSRRGEYRMPTGAMPCGGTVRLRCMAQRLSAVTLRLWINGAEKRHFMRDVGNDVFEYKLALPDAPCLVWYYFVATDEWGNVWYLGNADDELGGEGICRNHEPASFQITVYDESAQAPEWMRNSVMMQIFPDRFFNAGGTDVKNLPAGSYYHPAWDDDPALVINDKRGTLSANDFFGGNLRGIEAKLDYIASMGVKAIYLNPIFQANSNHKYNTGDYRKIDPAFGTEKDFAALCRSAKARGIRIVLDGVFSHTGSDSVYFDRYGNYGGHGAYCDPESPYRDWYKFKRWPDEYESWWGFTTLPDTCEDDPSFRDFIIEDEDSVAAHWMKAGASGWRLDVADELPMDFIRAFRRREKAIDPDAALIGEVWEDPSRKVTYGELRCYCGGDTLDATMNYPLREAVLDFMLCRLNAPGFARRIASMRENLPAGFFYSQLNMLGSHDKPRALTVLADIGNMEPERKYRYPVELSPDRYDLGRRRLIAAWDLMCFLPGMPCLYYGDEAGLYGMSDPYCRGTYPWGREDEELIEAFREAAQRRNDSQTLRTGDMKITAVGEDVLLVERFIRGGRDVFGRGGVDEVRALAVNRAGESRWIEYDGVREIPAQSAVVLK